MGLELPIAAPATVEREQLAIATCGMLLYRLTRLVQEENALLSQPKTAFCGQLTERKTQLLRDLIVAERGCKSPWAAQVLSQPAAALREELARNQRLLGVHIKAVKDVSGIIVDAIRQADSDGTYSRYGRA